MADVDDNPYTAWTPPVDDSNKLKALKEEAKLSSSIGILQDFLHDLEEDIELYRGTDMIEGVNVSTDANDLKLAVLVNNQVRDKLKRLRDKYRVRYGQYIEELPVD